MHVAFVYWGEVHFYVEDVMIVLLICSNRKIIWRAMRGNGHVLADVEFAILSLWGAV